MNDHDNDDLTNVGLSDAQEKVLSILPIPSALLSLMGSLVIIYVVQTSKMNSPYSRLLLGMSVSDIIFSITLALAAFLRPQDKSTWVWARGNDATCSASGFLFQIGISTTFYNGMLSFYFLLTARFRFTNQRIAKYIEPWMHAFSIGFPLIGAILGAGYGLYGEQATGMGCWFAPYPTDCYETDQVCIHLVLGSIFYGFPAFAFVVSLIVNNLVISCFVWRHTRPRHSAASNAKRENTTTTASSIASASGDSSPNSSSLATLDDFTQLNEQQSTHQANQNRRLRLVASQAILYVAAYIVCNFWPGFLTLSEIQTVDQKEEMEMMERYYAISVISAILFPLQGLFNMLVFIRPKYKSIKSQFPNETAVWAIRRAVLGESVKPTNMLQQEKGARERVDGAKNDAKVNKQTPEEQADNKFVVNSISSLTAASFNNQREEGRVVLSVNEWESNVVSEIRSKPSWNLETTHELEQSHDENENDKKLQDDLQMLRELKDSLEADVGQEIGAAQLQKLKQDMQEMSNETASKT